ncbi:MAG: ribosomal subunit interface protein [Candidatus Moranbacteria bacterium RIFCSPHIGHO2_01_FULL_54_31]|nr:MAG: ribosomal subunit interface protein [Candidatus Moranbacteria bacterium RIFCSPHIGHO2_01_FULL_54_31]
MNTRFLFKGVEIDGRTQEYVLKRLERVEKLVDPVSEFEVEVDRDKKGKFRVEIMIKTPHNLYRAEETSVSIEGSTDIVIDELEVQIAKQKNKHHDLKLRGNRSIKKNLVVDESARF